MFDIKFIPLMILFVCSECKVSSIEKAYQKGIDAYSGERWSECIAQFEESIHLYKLYKSIVVNCRLKCKSKVYESEMKENIENLKLYEKLMITKNCINSCLEKGFGDTRLDLEVEEKVIFNMQARTPYEYLHMCYYHMNMLPKAASASYTYLVINPDHSSMKDNLIYYSNQAKVDVNEIVDLEIEDYCVMFELGLKSYKQNNWAETVASMEEVVTDYMSSENMCRAECETQPEQESIPEFVINLSHQVASLLHCQQQCQKKLMFLNYNSGVEFLANVLNYLQISYYHLDRFADAAKSVASYLVLAPTDEDMLANKNIYSTITDEKYFEARSDIIYYLKRDIYEKRLLELFHQGNDNEIESNFV